MHLIESEIPFSEDLSVQSKSSRSDFDQPIPRPDSCPLRGAILRNGQGSAMCLGQSLCLLQITDSYSKMVPEAVAVEVQDEDYFKGLPRG